MTPHFYRRKPKVRIVWHGPRPKRPAVKRTREELADLLDTGLSRPADLCFHEVWLGDGPEEPIVHCWGERGSGAFHAEYVETPKWVSLAEMEDGTR